MSTPTIAGVSTLIFGTASTLSDTSFSAAIIDSIEVEPLHERIKESGNSGFTKATIDIEDGAKITVRCLYDSAITWPSNGAVIGAKIKGETAAVLYEVIGAPRISRSRKGTATITIEGERHADITLTQS